MTTGFYFIIFHRDWNCPWNRRSFWRTRNWCCSSRWRQGLNTPRLKINVFVAFFFLFNFIFYGEIAERIMLLINNTIPNCVIITQLFKFSYSNHSNQVQQFKSNINTNLISGGRFISPSMLIKYLKLRLFYRLNAYTCTWLFIFV